MNQQDNTYIISLGGSLLFDATGTGINYSFLESFKHVILSYTQLGKRFFIIVGGGKVCRMYQQALQHMGLSSSEELDWIGIHSTRLNAQFVRMIFQDYAYDHIITDPLTDYGVNDSHNVLIAGGWKPGRSTDFMAVSLGEKYHSTHIINLSNIDYVYTKDPKKYPDAEIIKETNWETFRTIVGDIWTPGMSAPFDPIASKYAQKHNMTVAMLNGFNVENFDQYLQGKEFVGTVVK